MKNIMKMAAIAALLLSMFTSCKKTTDTAPTAQQSATRPDLHTMMKPYKQVVANWVVTGIKANPKWKYVYNADLSTLIAPWYDRVFFKGHTAIECDPHVWSQVEDLIRTRLSSDMVISQVEQHQRPED